MLAALGDRFQVLLHDVDGVIDLLWIMESAWAFEMRYMSKAEGSGRIYSLSARSRIASPAF